MTQNDMEDFRKLQLNRDWIKDPYKGGQETSVFASAQIWRAIDVERKKELIQDWSVPSREVGHGTLAQYLKYVAFMNSDHEDAFGMTLEGHKVSDLIQIAKFCKIWEDQGKTVESGVDKHIGIALALCDLKVRLIIQGIQERIYNDKDIADNSIQKIKAVKEMFESHIKPGYDCQRAINVLLDLLPMASTKEELVSTFTEVDLIMDVARLTLLGIDKEPKK